LLAVACKRADRASVMCVEVVCRALSAGTPDRASMCRSLTLPSLWSRANQSAQRESPTIARRPNTRLQQHCHPVRSVTMATVSATAQLCHPVRSVTMATVSATAQLCHPVRVVTMATVSATAQLASNARCCCCATAPPPPLPVLCCPSRRQQCWLHQRARDARVPKWSLCDVVVIHIAALLQAALEEALTWRQATRCSARRVPASLLCAKRSTSSQSPLRRACGTRHHSAECRVSPTHS
jgi:hypothetical protein